MEFLKCYQLDIMLFLTGICAILSFLVAISTSIPKSRKKPILVVEFATMVLLIADRFAYLYRGDVSMTGWWAVRLSNFFVFLMSLSIIYGFNMYLIDLYTHEARLASVPRRLRICKWILRAGQLLVVFSQFTDLYYTFDAQNRYHRAPLMPVSYVFSILPLILQTTLIIFHSKKLQLKTVVPLVLFTVLPIFASCIQFFAYGISLTNISVVGSAIILYVFALQNLNESVRRAHRFEIQLLEMYKSELEKTVEERTQELKIANEKAENLILNILPKEIADELAEHPDKTIANEYPNATVLFTDVVGFTKMSSTMSARETVSMLNQMISILDDRAREAGIEKIKTIGDSYMAASGLTAERDNDGADRMLMFAKNILSDIADYNKTAEQKLKIRIGINTGSLVGGVIGKTKFIYDVWGDTVNVASRMESTAEPMKIHVTERTLSQCHSDCSAFEKVEMEIKGKGKMNTYYL